MKRILAGLFVGLFLATSLSYAEHQKGHNEKGPRGKGGVNSLYNRLGGINAIAMVTNDFVGRLLVNKTLNDNPTIKSAFAKANRPALEFHLNSQLCQVTGGPCKYTGRMMKETHKDMGITEKDWDAMVSDFKVTLEKFNVPAKEQEELIAIVATTKKDIVMQPVTQAKNEKPTKK